MIAMRISEGQVQWREALASEESSGGLRVDVLESVSLSASTR